MFAVLEREEGSSIIDSLHFIIFCFTEDSLLAPLIYHHLRFVGDNAGSFTLILRCDKYNNFVALPRDNRKNSTVPSDGMRADCRVKLVEINTQFLGLVDLTQIQVLRNQLRDCSLTSDWDTSLLRETRLSAFSKDAFEHVRRGSGTKIHREFLEATQRRT